VKWSALILLAGCAGPMGTIVTDTGDLSEATSAPRVNAILELGGGDVILTADLRPGPGDGLATVGEALWVRGSNFGRLPTVIIAGRPAAVLARTTDGGLVARVPPGVPVGEQALLVANQEGHGQRALMVRRLIAALPPEGGRLILAELGDDGPRAVGEIPAAGQLVAVGWDGRAAYVLDRTNGRITVFELPAQGGPRAEATLDLDLREARGPRGPRGPGGPRSEQPEDVTAFAAASAAPVLMILRGHVLTLLDISAPLRPGRTPSRTLPATIPRGQIVVAALSPDARLLAVALEAGNRLVLLDLRREGPASVMGEVALAPEARVPVIADVAFSPDGRTLWAALGDTAKSRAVGPQPTELVSMRIDRAASGEGRPPLAIARRVRVDEATAPVRLNTGRTIPLVSGASIRLPPERAEVYLTAHNRAGAATIFRLGSADRATPFADVSGNAGAAELSPDGRWLLVPVAQASRRLAIVSVPADEHPGPQRVVDLGATAGEISVPSSPRLPSLGCQP